MLHTQNPAVRRLAAALDCRSVGEGDPLLLIHGIQGTGDAWSSVLPQLLHRRCLMPNLPGRMLSPRWRESDGPIEQYYHLDHYADLLHAVVGDLGAARGRPVALAGWSMGVSVILNLLERHPDLPVERVVLVSGTACATPGARWFTGETVEHLREEAVARAARLGLTQVADAEAVAWSWRSVRDRDFRRAAATLRCPALVIHGELDDQCPVSHGEYLAGAIPGAEWLQLPGVGHAALSQAPRHIAAAMREFLG